MITLPDDYPATQGDVNDLQDQIDEIHTWLGVVRIADTRGFKLTENACLSPRVKKTCGVKRKRK